MQLLTPALGLIVWTLLAFLVVFFILKKFAWPAIINGLRQREETIAQSLASAEKIKAEMAQMKSENEALLAQAREERANMLKDARTASDKMIADAKEKAKHEYDRIITDAQGAIDQQKNAAITDVKNMIGKLVIEVTEKVIRRELVNQKDHEDYIKKLTTDINAADIIRN
ncbi:MAG TPA: F0F1 ATP synthase subunit B [Parafilimonas sp.]|nr:F0F1 ATP synthase subunit B [Parafilimonas sp.]